MDGQPQSEAETILPTGPAQSSDVQQSNVDQNARATGANEGEASEQGNLEVSIRRSSTVKLKAGSAAWAKLAKYPWWPAQVLDEEDPWIPSTSEAPRLGAIPVRFFGTYDFAWIEQQRAVLPFDKNNREYTQDAEVVNDQSFAQAMAEAERFEQTQEVPDGFNEDEQPAPKQSLPRRTARPAMPKTRGKKGAAAGAGKGARRGGSEDKIRNSRDRQEKVLRQLALGPPPDSPFAHRVNLDGVRKLLELKGRGEYPPPAPPQVVQGAQFPSGLTYNQANAALYAQPQLSNLVAYAQQGQPQLAGLGMTQPQNAQQLHLLHQQQQQLLQHHLQQGGHQGQGPWFLQSMYNPQAGLSFLSQAGGVQGALLAAATQQHMQQGQPAFQQNPQFPADSNPSQQQQQAPK